MKLYGIELDGKLLRKRIMNYDDDTGKFEYELSSTKGEPYLVEEEFEALAVMNNGGKNEDAPFNPYAAFNIKVVEVALVRVSDLLPDIPIIK